MVKEKWVHWMMMVLHLIAVVIFTRGFLLTRTELPNFSQCDDVSQSPCSFLNQSHTHGRCWTKPAIHKLVIIVFDALRFDFVAPSTFFQEKKPWMNKLKLIHDLAATNASSARIFKAIADPPTTSLQRLKGLTTGGLPTFWYLHQVIEVLNLFLVQDHAGHIFGVDSPQMIEKLEQYNNVLQNVVEALESQSAPGGRHENTLLLVMGDHGQTVNGDHGGGTAEEVETSLFALSFKNPPSSIPAEFDTSSCGPDLGNRNICSSLQQLDFAATISALLVLSVLILSFMP